MPKLLYISGWNSGAPRGGFFSAATLLESLVHWNATLVVGREVIGAARVRTVAKVAASGYSDAPGRLFGGARLKALFSDALSAARQIRAEAPDLVVADFEVFLPFALASRLTRRPFAFYLRDIPNLARRRKLAASARMSRAAFFLSTAMSEAFTSNLPQMRTDWRSFIVPNCLAPSWFKDRPSRQQAASNTVRLGIVGALCEKKNQLWFLNHIVPHLRQRVQGVELHLFGEGSGDYGEAVKQRIRQIQTIKVVHHGFEQNPEKIFGNIDLLVQVSVTEGIARAVLEAATWEVPAVATEIIGVREYILDESTGFVAKSVDEMVSRLELLAVNAPLRLQFGSAARQFVMQRHAPGSVADKFQLCLDELRGVIGARP